MQTASKILIMNHRKAFCLTLRRQALVLATAGAFAAVSFASGADGSNGKESDHWVGTWGAALHEPDLGAPGLANTGFNNVTLRQIVHTSAGGRKARVPACDCPLTGPMPSS